MKNFKTLVIGFVAGATCMVSVTAFANYADITAKLFNDVTFTFDGTKVASPSEQPVLNYNGYTYVPLRFVAETLGATVNWDIATRDIDVQSDKKTYIKEVEVEKIVYVEKDPSSDTAVYSKLPQSARQNNHKIQVTGVDRNTVSQYTKLFVNVENLNQQGVQLVPSTSKLIVDGKEVDRFKIPSQWDTSWETKYIEYDDENDGYLIFDLIDEDYERLELSFDLRDIEGKTETYTFYIQR